nr:unnamed protein product [Digitaria exilis]
MFFREDRKSNAWLGSRFHSNGASCESPGNAWYIFFLLALNDNQSISVRALHLLCYWQCIFMKFTETVPFFSYRKQKLLKFFSDYVRTNDIFTFLRLVAAIWICSHSEEFEPLVLPELNEDYSLRDWCSREVLQCQVFTDHVQMTALVTALGVPLRVEYLLQGVGQDFYTDQEDSQDDTPRSTCWPHRQYQTPHGHVVPYVTVLYTNAHYDILYPHCRDVRSIDGRCNQLTAQVQRPTAASLSQQIARGESWSGADSSHRIIQEESSTGVRIQINMKCTRKLPLTGAHEYDEHRSILSEATDN